MNFNPETMTLTLDLLATTGFGCIMVFLGRAIVQRVRPFQEWGLPAPVIGGLLVALILSLLKAKGIFAVSWTTALSSHLMNIFFTCVGFGFSKTLLERGKKFCAGIALSVLLLVLLQGFLGIAVAIAVGMHPLLGIQIGTGALAGGVGTTSAFGPVYEAMGAVGATEIGVSSATLGMIIGSLTGGPLAVLLIKRHNLKADPKDLELLNDSNEETTALNHKSLLNSVCMMTIIAMCGIPIYLLLSQIPYIEMPYFIGCLFAGAIARNVLEALDVSFNTDEIETIEHVSLDIFLAITIMTMDLTRISGSIGEMLIVLSVVTIATLLFTYFIGFRMYHSDYNAACMCAGLIGMGMGSGSNAVANERAVMDKYGYAHIAWILYPAFSVLCVDIFNPLFMSFAPGFMGF
ncbi:MAG: sodium:glutamate symporter [Lachnoclostridium sp.]|nr:sodium:glutamate symporter [Lachnoclostridium sp.]